MAVQVVDDDASFGQVVKSTQHRRDVVAGDVMQEEGRMHDVPRVVLQIVHVTLTKSEAVGRSIPRTGIGDGVRGTVHADDGRGIALFGQSMVYVRCDISTTRSCIQKRYVRGWLWKQAFDARYGGLPAAQVFVDDVQFV